MFWILHKLYCNHLDKIFRRELGTAAGIDSASCENESGRISPKTVTLYRTLIWRVENIQHVRQYWILVKSGLVISDWDDYEN